MNQPKEIYLPPSYIVLANLSVFLYIDLSAIFLPIVWVIREREMETTKTHIRSPIHEYWPHSGSGRVICLSSSSVGQDLF